MKELALVLFGELQLIILIPTIILLVSGVVSFGLFISEESEQAVSFAAYGYVNAKDWEGLRDHLLMMHFIERSCGFYIKFIGWLSPLMYPAYLNYHVAFCAQIRSYERRVAKELSSNQSPSNSNQSGGWQR